MEPIQSPSRKLKIAKLLLYITGLFPFSVGTFFYITNLLNSRFNFIEHICFTNLMSTGVTVLVLTHFELDKKKLWVLALLFFIFAWVGGNDTYALVRNYFHGTQMFPVAMIPTTLGAISLMLISMDMYHE